MPRKKPNQTGKRPKGRPSAYREEFVDQAEKLCLLGATDAEMADFFGVSTQTLHSWKKVHPKFLDALTRGKIIADAQVAGKLFHRAMGYSHEAVKIFMPANAAAPIYAPYTEHYPPDTTAAIFWLKNRRKINWRDRQPEESDEDAGTVKIIGGLPDDD